MIGGSWGSCISLSSQTGNKNLIILHILPPGRGIGGHVPELLRANDRGCLRMSSKNNRCCVWKWGSKPQSHYILFLNGENTGKWWSTIDFFGKSIFRQTQVPGGAVTIGWGELGGSSKAGIWANHNQGWQSQLCMVLSPSHFHFLRPQEENNTLHRSKDRQCDFYIFVCIVMSDGENDGMTISLLWRGPGGCQNLEPRYHYRVPKHAKHRHVCSFESIIEQMLWRKSQQERTRICFSQGTAANWPCTLSSFDQTWNVFDDALKSPISVDVVESLPPHQAQVWLTFDLRSNFIRLDLATIGQMGDSAMRHLGI